MSLVINKENIHWNNMAKFHLLEHLRKNNKDLEPVALQRFTKERLKFTKEILKLDWHINSRFRFIKSISGSTRLNLLGDLKNTKREVKNVIKDLFCLHTCTMEVLQRFSDESAFRKRFLKRLEKGLEKLRKSLEGDLNDERKKLEDTCAGLVAQLGKLWLKAKDVTE